MNLPWYILIIILIALILVSGFFSGSEIGVMSLNRYRLKYLVKNKHKQAIRVSQMLAAPDRLLSVVLIGNTLANILASMIATLIGQEWHGELGVAIATAILTLVVLVFAEMMPKVIAAIYPETVAFKFSFLLKLLLKLFSPLVYITSGITQFILKLFGVSLDTAHKEALSGEELRSVVHEAGALLPTEHKTMLLGLLDLERAMVEDIMIPKDDIVGLDLDKPWYEVLETLETTQHTRLPLFRASIDQLIGIVHVRSILNLLLEEELDEESLVKIAETPYFVPSGTMLNIQILNFRKMKKRSCFVVNEYGDIQGLVTMEDILEEIVGEFTTNIAEYSQEILPQEDGAYIIEASSTIRSLNRMLHWNLPLIGPRTLSGLIVEYLGYIPSANSCLKLENFYIEILKVSDNRIKNVKIWRFNRKKLNH